MENFIKKYQKGDIIFPDVAARHLQTNLIHCYQKLNQYMYQTNEIKLLYLIKCPCCQRVNTDLRYYAPGDIPYQENYSCKCCREESHITFDDIIVIYEKC